MKKYVEKEFKSLLTEAEYEHLKTVFPNQKTVAQINVYYDSATNQLFNKQIMCRIRHYDNLQEFTMKIPNEAFNNTELEFTEETIDLNDERILTLLTQLKVDPPLHIVAQSKTMRTIIETEMAYLCLDETIFTNHIDYELEMELKEGHDAHLEDFLTFLNSLNIPYRQSLPKYMRALQDLQQ